MNSNFYKAFEDKFRGPREVIKSRLQVYLPFIEPLKKIYPNAEALDLGCGRGEWLELLAEINLTAQGVDLDTNMLTACHELGLHVSTGEAVSFLKSIPDNSQAIISGFHLAEHIPFNDLQELVKESLRVLKPAGILILETPNPENITVGSSDFYLDPTHQRPLPPKLLSFLAEFYGFEKVKILRLQEPTSSHNNESSSLFAVLNNASPDYAVIAQKTAKDELISLTKKPFESEYGVTIERLTKAYDLQFQKTIELAERANLSAEQAILTSEQAILTSEQAILTSEQTNQTLQDILSSRSWRITAPLRWIKQQTRLLSQHGILARSKALIKKIIRPLALRSIAFINTHSVLRFGLIKIAKKIKLYDKFRTQYLNLSSQTHTLTKTDSVKHTYTVSNTNSQSNYIGTLSIDEIQSRIKMELATHQKNNI